MSISPIVGYYSTQNSLQYSAIRPIVDEKGKHNIKKRKPKKIQRKDQAKEILFSNPLYEAFQEFVDTNQEKHHFGPWASQELSSEVGVDMNRQNQSKQNNSQTKHLVDQIRREKLAALERQNFMFKKKLQNVSSRHSLIYKLDNIPRNGSLPQLSVRKMQIQEGNDQKNKKFVLPSYKFSTFEEIFPQVLPARTNEKSIEKAKKVNIFRNVTRNSKSILKIVFDCPQQINSQPLLKQKLHKVVYNYCNQEEHEKMKVKNPQETQRIKRTMLSRIRQNVYKKTNSLENTFKNKEKIRVIDLILKKKRK